MRLRAAKTAAAALLRRIRPRPRPLEWGPAMPVAFHDAPEPFRERFAAAGFKSRFFVPHRIHCLPKAGPDGYRLADRMCDVRDADRLWQIVLFATPPVIDEFPDELFFDPDLLWHQQHFNQVGQIASVDLVAAGTTLYTMAHQSDLVQRISRRRSFKTRVEKVFRGWHHLLLNGIASFAAARGFRELRVPTSRLAIEHTDRARTVQPELFERVYDRAVRHHFRATEVDGWWSIDVGANRAAIVTPDRHVEPRAFGKTVCVCHDIERGHGHRHVAPEFARRADGESAAALDHMLDIERRAGVRATYNVMGCFLSEVRDRIERAGHGVAFHSYDHDIAREQLAACRTVDYRIKGYRPPQSVVTAELLDDRLCWHNFEWLASSASSLRSTLPMLDHRLVRIPILFDDFALHAGKMSFEEWHRRAVDAIRAHDFVAFSLHDCYAPHWLPHYERLLEEIKPLGRFRTMDEVAGDLYMAGGV